MSALPACRRRAVAAYRARCRAEGCCPRCGHRLGEVRYLCRPCTEQQRRRQATWRQQRRAKRKAEREGGV